MASLPLAWYAMKRIPSPVWAGSLAGWIAILSLNATYPPFDQFCVSGPAGIEVGTQLARAGFVWPSLLLASSAMLLAINPPLMVGALLHVWRRSLTKRRMRAVLIFVAAYVAVWLPVWLVVSQVSLAAFWAMAWPEWSQFPLLCALAIVWQITPLKQTCLNACHRRPSLSVFGFRAELDAVAFGLRQGSACIGSCWALMLFPFATTGNAHSALMACAMVLLLQERIRAPQPSYWGAALPALRAHIAR